MRRGIRITLGLMLGGSLVVGVSVLVAGSLLTRPARHTVGDAPADLHAVNVSFTGSHGSRLRGWFVPGKPGRGAVMLLHGVRGDRCAGVERARLLSREGFAVLLFDFQAHGESEGDRITFGRLESLDAAGALEFLKQKCPGEKTAVIGSSLGGAAALLADPPLDTDALVVEQVFPTIEQAVSDRMERRLGPLGPPLGPLLTCQLKPRTGISCDELRPIDGIGRVHVPLLLVAGTKDRHTHIEESRAIFANANEPKEMWEIEGADHVDLCGFAGKEYERRVLEFLNGHLFAGGR